MKKRTVFGIVCLLIAGVCLLLSWKVKGFTDIYVKNVFPIWLNTYGRLSGIFKFSVGELLLFFGAIYVVITVITWIIRPFFAVRKKNFLKGFVRVNSKVFFALVGFIVFVQIMNCFVLYHETPLYESTSAAEYKANRADLIDLREKLAKRANELCETFERDSKGYLVYDKDIASIAMISMQGIGEAAYERVKCGEASDIDEKLALLRGFYSRPKPFIKSDFFSQQGICGYYFPFTLEANYNNMMYIANFPSTMCHELSHLKGFIFEDEASFISYLACLDSKEPFFEYSAVLNALAYVNVEVKRELAVEPEIREQLTQLKEWVTMDSVFLTSESWDIVESDNIFSTDMVNQASETFLDTNLTLNGVSDGIVSYSRIVDLLLKYYYAGD